MARGITELDVHGAADALVAKGERPTVERVRAHLGTGSPNTVTRLLETWWQSLGSRLHPESSGVKDAPAVVGKLAGQWWALALEHARDAVVAEFSEAREDLALKQDELLVRSKALAGSERESLAEHVRSVENRTLGDLDRARQESKVLQAQLASALKRHASIEAEMRGNLEKAHSATAAALQMVDNQRGRSAALEEQLAKLQNLPADLEAALRRGQVTSGPRKTSPKQRAKKSSSKATN